MERAPRGSAPRAASGFGPQSSERTCPARPFVSVATSCASLPRAVEPLRLCRAESVAAGGPFPAVPLFPAVPRPLHRLNVPATALGSLLAGGCSGVSGRVPGLNVGAPVL